MNLTPEQILTLRTFINADPILNTYPHTGAGAFEIGILLSAEASPAYVVWNHEVFWDEIMENGLDWTLVDNLTVGKARIWEWLFRNETNSINAGRANVRAGIDECWKGTAAMLAQRDTIYTHLKRNATLFEKAFATGNGTILSPSTLGLVNQTLSFTDVLNVMGW